MHYIFFNLKHTFSNFENANPFFQKLQLPNAKHFARIVNYFYETESVYVCKQKHKRTLAKRTCLAKLADQSLFIYSQLSILSFHFKVCGKISSFHGTFPNDFYTFHGTNLQKCAVFSRDAKDPFSQQLWPVGEVSFGIQKGLFRFPLKPTNGVRLITLMAMASKTRSFYYQSQVGSGSSYSLVMASVMSRETFPRRKISIALQCALVWSSTFSRKIVED